MADLFAVVQNPILQAAAKGSFFEVPKDDEETAMRNANVYSQQQNVLEGVTEADIVNMKRYHTSLRYWMLFLSTLMIICGYYNISITNGSSAALIFLALYVFFFATLICCHECALQAASVIIIQNFGFMYNPYGRTVFLILVSIMLFQLSLFGKVLFGFLLATIFAQLYVNLKFPKFERFQRLTNLGIPPIPGSR